MNQKFKKSNYREKSENPPNESGDTELEIENQIENMEIEMDEEVFVFEEKQ